MLIKKQLTANFLLDKYHSVNSVNEAEKWRTVETGMLNFDIFQEYFGVFEYRRKIFKT